MKKLCFTAFDNGITHFDLANNYGPEPGSCLLYTSYIEEFLTVQGHAADHSVVETALHHICVPAVLCDLKPVSYTHLNVYKRQVLDDLHSDQNCYTGPPDPFNSGPHKLCHFGEEILTVQKVYKLKQHVYMDTRQNTF